MRGPLVHDRAHRQTTAFGPGGNRLPRLMAGDFLMDLDGVSREITRRLPIDVLGRKLSQR